MRLTVKSRWSWLVAAAFAVAALIAGCGSSGSSGTTAGTLPKDEYIKRADAICTKNEQKQLQLVTKFQKEHSAQGPKAETELVEFAGLPPLVKETKELMALPLPTTGTEEAEEFVDALQRGLKEVEEDPASILAYEGNPLEEAETLAETIGFKTCGGV